MSFRMTRIGDLGRVVTGRTPPAASPHFFGDLYPFITPTDIQGDVRYLSPARMVSEAGRTAMHRVMLPANAICVVCIGATIGKVCMTDQPSFTNQQINAIMVDEREYDAHYVFAVARMLQEELRRRASGAATPIVNKSSFEDVAIPTPDLGTQIRIGAFLSAYDDLIEVNQRRIAILGEVARRLFEEWFVRFRFPGSEGLFLVDGPFGPIPEGWRVRPLEDLCIRITDGAHHSPPSTEDGLPMASVKDMQTWDFNLSTCRRISEADYADLERNDCKPLKGDVVIAKDGSYLKHVFLVREERRLAILSSIAILRPNGELHPDIFVQFLRDQQTSERMKGFVSGVAIPRIVLKDFRKFLLLCPPGDLQARWAKLASPTVQQCWNLDRQNTHLRAARDVLLPKLISGEIAVGAAERALEDAA